MVSAYFAGTILVVCLLADRARWALWVSLAVGTLVALAVPVATMTAPGLHLGRDRPLLARYLGRSDLSRAVIAAARASGVAVIATDNRDIIADLFYTGRGSGLTFHALAPPGRPGNFYEQMHALPPDQRGPVLAVLSAPPDCGAGPLAPVARFDTSRGAYAKLAVAAYVTEARCVAPHP